MKFLSRLMAAVCVVAFPATALQAQTLLGGAEFSAKLPLGFSAGAEAEYRTMDWFDHTEQWSVAANVGYKPLKWLKVGVQYKFIQAQSLAGVTNKGYTYGDYWDSKHRVSLSATGSLKLAGKFTLSLRERYQYTYRPSHLIPRFDDEGAPAGNRTIDSKSKHILRSRLQAEFKPYKKCRWTPHLSVELYSLLSDVNHTDKLTEGGKFCDKWRLTAGTEFRINKHNDLDLFYRYANTTDADEREMHHTIGLVYSFSL